MQSINRETKADAGKAVGERRMGEVGEAQPQPSERKPRRIQQGRPKRGSCTGGKWAGASLQAGTEQHGAAAGLYSGCGQLLAGEHRQAATEGPRF